jgi:hypothetical protein
MDLYIERKSYGGVDHSWLGSRRGVDTARTVTLSAAAFTDKAVKSGQPLAKNGDVFEPYTAAAGQTLAGFLLEPVDVSRGDAAGPLLDTGRIITANLPVAFTPPAAAGGFVFI